MKASSLLLATLAAVISQVRCDVTEPASKISFKESVKLPGNSGSSSLAGTGVRVKKIGPAAVKVYAVGIYVDDKGARNALKQYASSVDVDNDEQFFSTAMKGAFDKTLVLKMARTVGTEKMVSALAESVKPRLSGATGDLAQFESILLQAVGQEGAAKKDMQFGFVCKPGGLCVSINGKEAGTVNSKALSDAMVDVYLGKKAVSPAAKSSFGKGILKLLR